MIALAFAPIIWLKIHHKTGFPYEPETEFLQAALRCVFKRPRRDSATSKAENVSLLLFTFQVSGGITLYVSLARWRQENSFPMFPEIPVPMC